jgi:molybdopterin converting factor small subunit
MQVRVLLFGPEATALGRREATVEVPPVATCAHVKAALAASFPAIAGAIDAARLAVNAEFALPSRPIAPGDEVALIGMVSGG